MRNDMMINLFYIIKKVDKFALPKNILFFSCA